MVKGINIFYKRKLLALKIIVLLLSITQPFAAFAQTKFSKFKNADDSLVMVKMHTSRLHPYAGLHLSSDPELYYLGPSFQAGVDFNFTRHLALSTYIHYFYVSVNKKDISGITEIGRFKTFTSAILIQADAGAGWYKGFFIAGGIALQQFADRFQGVFGSFN